MKEALIAWGPAAVWAVVLFLLSEIEPSGIELAAGLDKLAHLALYAVLGVALAWGGSRSSRVPAWLPPAAGVLYGTLDEWHQSFVPGRDPSGWDVVADAGGIAAGYLLFVGFRRGVRSSSRTS